MIDAWIGLGSNLGERVATLDAALARIDRLEATRLRAVSRYYYTPPWGDPDQPEFVNAVARAETGLTAAELLRALLAIESDLGRERSDRRWGPRAIDLDLLLYGDERIDEAALTVPHPRMRERAFVLVPVLELAPNLIVPGQGRADALLAELDDNDHAGIRPGPEPGYRPPDDRPRQDERKTR